MMMLVYSILTLELMTPRESRPQKPLHNLHAPSAGGVQCEQNSVCDQLLPRQWSQPPYIAVPGTHFSIPLRVFHTFNESRGDSSRSLT